MTEPVLEHALLHIRPGQNADFEAAFSQARPLVSASPGFLSLDLLRGLESPDTYLLLVRWRTVADHEIGFRRSPAYQEWKALLHHFYAPFPTVEHFTAV